MTFCQQSARRPVALWLFVCCGMVFVMALLGAITRLTESGLSITDWAPATGALPPLNEAAWNNAFAAYQKIPQYQLLNRGMTLEEFKVIYFWEWLHRLWGRLIGVVLLLPLIYFAVRKKISRELGLKLFGIFVLGGLQGFIGWFMVQSGLDTRTSVSPYRLALHFGFAMVIYSLMLWTALGLFDPRGSKRRAEVSFSMARHGWVSFGLLALTMLWGAFTAGLHAGEAYNTWPLMEGEFFPSAALTIMPKWLNVFENLAFVQFIHRWLGPITAAAICAWGWRLWRRMDNVTDRKWILALIMMAFAQAGLGLLTLLSHAQIALASMHQGGAILLLTFILINLKRLAAPSQAH